MRISARDDLAIHFQHEPQHPMRRRVLWAKIQGEILDKFFGRSFSDNVVTERNKTGLRHRRLPNRHLNRL